MSERPLERLNDVFKQVFGDPDLRIHPQMTAKDVNGWDSFNHINLVIAIEDAFGVQFTSEEIGSLANVGELVSLLRAKGQSISF